jgi:hypothetical protein
MLYDNAQLAMIYLRAASILKQPAYRDIAIETMDFMLAEMRMGPAFVTSISALDEQGREGGAYLWSREELEAMLHPDEFALVGRIWGMEAAVEFDLGYLPMNRKQPTPVEQKALVQIYAKLSQRRMHQALPKDIKLLAGLNGLALAAFSEAADIAPRFRQAAKELHAFMRERLWQDGVLFKGMSRQQLLNSGDLESYAYSAYGLMRYATLSGNAEDVKLAGQIARAAWKKFHTPNGFVLEERSALAKPYYQSVVEDGPLPSPSSILIDVSLRSGDRALHEQARNALAEGEVLQKQGLFWFASQVSALNRLVQKN